MVRDVLWEALPRLRSVASEPSLSLSLAKELEMSPVPASDLWNGLRALQVQQQQQVEFMERVQREHLEVQLQMSKRLEKLELEVRLG